MVCLGLWKGLCIEESLELGFEPRQWGDLADWQATNSRQSERTHACICSLLLVLTHLPTCMHAHTHTVFCRKKSEVAYFAENWYPIVFLQILKELCCICTDSEGTLFCLYRFWRRMHLHVWPLSTTQTCWRAKVRASVCLVLFLFCSHLWCF